jgi:uncharacterized protein (DUF1330 family)
MPAYLVVDETITDSEVFEDYKRGVLPTISKFGGRFLARGSDMEILESGKDWTPGRMVIVEFPNMSALKDWYDSYDYAPVRDLRFRSATSTVVALDGGGGDPAA